MKEKPNRFTLKLRKHLKGLFFDNIEQVGVERVIKITFQRADRNKDFTFFLFVEFYAKGNMILTNSDLITMASLRDHEYDEENKVCKDFPYPLKHAAKFYYEDLKVNEESFGKI